MPEDRMELIRQGIRESVPTRTRRVHTTEDEQTTPAEMVKRLEAAGVSGGVLSHLLIVQGMSEGEPANCPVIEHQA